MKKKLKKEKVISVGNPKGGVGKTATTVSIARIIKDQPAFQGKRILLIDTDPLGILTKMIVTRKTKVKDYQTLLPVFLKSTPISNVIQKNAWPKINNDITIDYICSNRNVAKLETIEHFDLYRLKTALDEIKEHYFKIIIDCPANSNNLYFSSCIASDLMIFPFGGIESISGLEVTAIELCKIDETIIDNIKILFTMQDINSKLTASLINTARQYLDFSQFETIIRRSDRFSLEIADSQTTGTYHIPESIAINDYLFLVDELFADDFNKTFSNKQSFTFGSSKIEERLWATFYETSFLITNEREKARLSKPKDALQEVHNMERLVKDGKMISTAISTKSKKTKSRKILFESCFKNCTLKHKILSNYDFFYIAELLPSKMERMKKAGKNRPLFLFHPECLEKGISRLFFQKEIYDASRMSLSHILKFSNTAHDVRINKTIRKKMKTSFLTFIRDPNETSHVVYLIHIWTLFREREFITRWLPNQVGKELNLFGNIFSFLLKGETIVIAGIQDPTLNLTKKNLTQQVHYRNFMEFKTFIDERLKPMQKQRK